MSEAKASGITREAPLLWDKFKLLWKSREKIEQDRRSFDLNLDHVSMKHGKAARAQSKDWKTLLMQAKSEEKMQKSSRVALVFAELVGSNCLV